jgi:hypothetical protein
MSWAGGIAVAIFVFWLAGGFIWTIHLLGADALLGIDTESMLSTDIPKCNSVAATGLAKQALAGAPLFKTLNVNVFEIRDAEELAFDPAAQKRLCKATAFLNSGKHEVQYTIEWQDQKAKTVWVQVTFAN